MHRRYNLVHLILASVVVWGLAPLMVCVDAQAQIAFASNRDGNWEIYVMDADGKNQQRLTRNHHSDVDTEWFGPALAVTPTGKQFAMWGWLKQVDR